MADTSYQIDIGVGGSDVVASAADAVDRLALRLEASSSASRAATDAVRAADAAYRQAETTADRAAKALEKLNLQADEQKGKLRAALDAGDMSSAARAEGALAKLALRQGEATSKAAEASAAMRREAADLDRLRGAADTAAQAEAKVAGALEKARAATAAQSKAMAAAAGSGKVNEAAEALGKLGGPLGETGSKALGAVEGLQKLGASLGAGGPYVAAAAIFASLVAGIAAVSAAAVAGVAAITQWAVGLADAARSQRLLSDGIAGSVAGGRALDATVKSIQSRVPVATDELMRMAGELTKAGVKGDALAVALEDAAAKSATLKMGPDYAKGLLAIDYQVARLKDHLTGKGGLFSSLQIDGLLSGLSTLVGLFDANNASGRALKVVFESLFQPIVDAVTALMPRVRSAFIQLEILLLKGMIAIKPYGSEIVLLAEAFAVLGGIILGVVGVAAAAFFGPLVAIVGVVTALIAGVLWLTGELIRFSDTIVSSVSGALDWFSGAIDDALTALDEIDLVQTGVDLVEGLAQGILAGAVAVPNALKSVVDSAITTAKSALGIASPSKVFEEIGGYTAEGMVKGIDGGAPSVGSALEGMTDPSAATPAATPSGGSSTSATISGNTFHLHGLAGADEAVKGIESLLTRLLEGDVAQLGGAVPT